VLFDLGVNSLTIERDTTSLLGDALGNTGRQHALSTVVLTPSSLRTLPATVPPPLVRRISNIGDTFVEPDAAMWGNKKAGMLPISPWQLNSLLRLVRLLNTHTTGRDIGAQCYVERCPLCSSSRVIAEHASFQCGECGTRWGRTRCKNPACKNEFGWLCASSKNSLQACADPNHYGTWLERLENLSDDTAVTGFCEAPLAKRATVPICPKCGRCHQRDEHRHNCLRCERGE
jgi:hypothetical protein